MRTPDEWVKILRSSSEGNQIVRLSDMSTHGMALETLTPGPWKVGETILIVDSGIGLRNRRAVVRHISPRKSDDGEEIFIVGVEFTN